MEVIHTIQPNQNQIHRNPNKEMSMRRGALMLLDSFVFAIYQGVLQG